MSACDVMVEEPRARFVFGCRDGEMRLSDRISVRILMGEDLTRKRQGLYTFWGSSSTSG